MRERLCGERRSRQGELRARGQASAAAPRASTDAFDLYNVLGDLASRACLCISAHEWIIRVLPLPDKLIVTDIGTFSETWPAVDAGPAEALCAEHDTEWLTGQGAPWIVRGVRPGESLSRAVSDVEAAYDALKRAVQTCAI
jgi:hypothetical protein